MSVTPGVQIKCKICGESEFEKVGNREVCRCCKAVYVAYDPGLEAELRMAESFRESAQFDVAATLYNKLLRTYEGQELSDVYWGLFLCEQRVMFETDEHGERFPSFYAIVPAAPKESAALQNAIRSARLYDPEKAEVFSALAERVTSAKELYRRINAASKPYDIFICFKRSATDGAATKDTDLAIDLYNNFAQNYRIFFSERSLRDVVVRDFEPNIYYALYTAKVMLLLCSKREYLESRWVKNEWSRYHAFAQDPVAGKTIIPIFLEDFTPAQLPRELSGYQGLCDGRHLFDELGRTLQKILKPVDMEAKLDQKLQEAMEQQRKLQEQQAAEERRRMQEQLEKLANRPVATAARGSADVDVMLRRMRVFLEEKDFKNAQNCADRALETDPGNGDAYLGKLLANQKASTLADLRNCNTAFDTDPSYRYVLRFADTQTVDTLNACLAEVKERQRKAAEAAERERKWQEAQRLRREAEQREREEKERRARAEAAERERKWQEAQRLKMAEERRAREEAAEKERQRREEERRERAERRKKVLRIAIPIACAILLVAVSVTLFIWNRNNEWQDGVHYVRREDGFHVKAVEELATENLVIPEIIDGVPVTSVGEDAFKYCDKLISVKIPASVTSVDVSAFCNCSNLTTVDFAENSKLKNIGKTAFSGCINLNSITIPDGVTSIDEWAFYGCGSLMTVAIPTSVLNIGEYAFSNCGQLASVTLSENLTTIDAGVFATCGNLTSITIPASVTSIGESAFHNCDGITTIKIPSNVKNIKERAFYGCDYLLTVEFGENSKLEEIGKEAFAYCVSLDNITIPASVTDIYYNAFSCCTSLIYAIFEQTEGWLYGNDLVFLDRDIANPYTAAKYLRLTYAQHAWYRYPPIGN